ncbi:MAG: 30S ribosomal protein S17 [Chitinispirillaceae bacterium]|nr:30S ribosomal protein S17 [Chitinispirillaceae bacterium]
MEERGKRKERVGTVVSDKMDKTIIVRVERRYTIPSYGRTMLERKKYVVHDEKDECKAGDRVRIVETRPLSKTKRWRMAEIIQRAQ